MSADKSIYWSPIYLYCQYRERNHNEVRQKLLTLGATGLELENIIAELISRDILNEERYARSFARGHFNLKKWGRNKIITELKKHKTSDYCIKKALLEIDEEQYQHTLNTLLQKKATEIGAKTKLTPVQKNKLYRYLIQKGYESQYISKLILNFSNSDN